MLIIVAMKQNIRNSQPADILQLLDGEEQRELFMLLKIENESTLNSFATTDLLLRIVELRSPFIKMFHDITQVLSTIEVSIRGNIDFIVLPSTHKSIEVEFSKQVRNFIATALDERLLIGSVESLLQLIDEFNKNLYDLEYSIKSKVLKEDSNQGRLLRNMSERMRYTNSAKAFRYEYLANSFSYSKRYYHQSDLASLKKIEIHANFVDALLNKNDKKILNDHQKKIVDDFRKVTHKLTGLIKNISSHIYQGGSSSLPYAKDYIFNPAHSTLNRLAEIIASMSFQEETFNDLFDFMKLTVWKQRWRIYELWLLNRVMLTAKRLGAVFHLGNRVNDGKWLLKFTKDTAEIATLDFNGVVVNLYYQLFESGKSGNNMPDIVLKSPSFGNLLVLDPKHGLTYSLAELKVVCNRYEKAFKPAFSCVANYFPPKEKSTAEVELANNAALILYNVKPGSTTLKLLDEKIEAQLHQCLPKAALSVKTIWVLFDVSGSAAGIAQTMAKDLQMLTEKISLTDQSCILPFSTRLHTTIKFDQDWKYLLQSTNGSGTSTNHALREVEALLSKSQHPTDFWLFTDGQDIIDISLFCTVFGDIKVTLFDYGNPSNSILATVPNLTDKIVYWSKESGIIDASRLA